MMPPRRLLALVMFAGLGLAQVAAADPDDHDLNYVFLQDDGHTSMSGNMRDVERARRLQHGKEPVLWFRDGGQDYVVRDADTLRQLDAISKPVRELGEAQGKLGTQMGELGSQQGRLGSRQGLLGTRQGTLAVRESALDMRDASDTLSAADRAEIAKQRRALRDQQRELEKQMRGLDRQMRELGQQMEPLSKQMEALALRMQVASKKADADLRALMRRAVSTGLAKPAR